MTDQQLEVIKKDATALSHPFMEKLQLIKETICVGLTDNEFKLFMYQCSKMGLDPLVRQIYPVKRWNSALGREAMTIQTGIDGYRLIADRTGRYFPGKDPELVFDKDGGLVSAKSYIEKKTQDGKWREVDLTAYYCEYVALGKNGKPNHMWATKPRIMLAKCAEAMLLRKVFPAELSGVYTQEEMDQADNPTVNFQKTQAKIEEQTKPYCSQEQYDGFLDAWSATHEREVLISYITKRANHYNEDVRQTVYELMQDQEAFQNHFIHWKSKNGNGKVKELVQAPSAHTA